MSTNTRGVVLISVMMIMLILSAIGVSLSQNYFLALKREGYVNFENNALAQAFPDFLTSLASVTDNKLQALYLTSHHITSPHFPSLLDRPPTN